MEPSQRQQAWARRGFSYTVWTDPPGQVWADFVHEVDELVTLVEGEIELSFQGQTLRPRIGEEVCIPAGARHTVRNTGKGYRGTLARTSRSVKVMSAPHAIPASLSVRTRLIPTTLRCASLASEQQPAPDTVQDGQRHCANEGRGDVVNRKIVEQRTGQKQQEGINHKNKQPQAQNHGNKSQDQQHWVE